MVVIAKATILGQSRRVARFNVCGEPTLKKKSTSSIYSLPTGYGSAGSVHAHTVSSSILSLLVFPGPSSVEAPHGGARPDETSPRVALLIAPAKDPRRLSRLGCARRRHEGGAYATRGGRARYTRGGRTPHEGGASPSPSSEESISPSRSPAPQARYHRAGCRLAPATRGATAAARSGRRS